MDTQQGSEIPLPNPGGQVAEWISLFRLGANRLEHQLDFGRIPDFIWCDSTDIAGALAIYQRQGVALPVYLGHARRDPSTGEPIETEERRAVGWMGLEQDASGGLGARVRWTPEGLGLVASGAYAFDSPEILKIPGPDGRMHLLEVRATALVNKPARSGSRPLVMQTMNPELNPTAKKLQKASTAHADYMKALQELAETDGETKTFADNLLGGLAAPQTELRRLCETLIPQQPAESQAQAADMSAAAKPTAPAPAMSGDDAAALRLGKHVQSKLQARSADEAMGVFDNLLPAPQQLSAAQGEVKELLFKEGLQAGVFKQDERAQLLNMSADYLRGRLRPLTGQRHDLSADERPARPSHEARSEGAQADADAKQAGDEIDRAINRHKIGGAK